MRVSSDSGNYFSYQNVLCVYTDPYKHVISFPVTINKRLINILIRNRRV